MTPDLLHRTVLVTGSTDGIGAVVAAHVASRGAFVVVSGRDADRGDAVLAAIRADGGQGAFVAADLAGGLAAITALVDGALAATTAAGRRLDTLVNNAAALVSPGPTADVQEHVIDNALAVNVKAPFLLTGTLATRWAADGQGGVVVNLGSINGYRATPGSALYSASKAAIHSLTRTWAAELAPAGIRVNAVAPGPTHTAKTAAMADRLAPVLATAPSRRASRAEEVAAAVAFLVGDDATNIYGEILSVDGGLAVV